MARAPLLNVLVAIYFASTVVLCSSNEDDNNDQCGLYLAVSSTSTVDETKWGLFAGKAIEPNTPIGYPEVGIVVPYLRAHALAPITDDAKWQLMEGVVTYFESFFWVSETIGAKFEYDATETESKPIAVVSGPGVLCSYNDKLTSAGWNISSAYHRTLMGETAGSAHPNRGANSHFYGAHIQSTKLISPGAEIFLEFGHSWKEEEENAENDIVATDYEKLDATVQQIINFFEKHKEKLTDPSSKDEIYNFVIRDVLKAAVGQEKAKKLAALLPVNPDDLSKVVEAGGSLNYGAPGVFRDLDWLQKHGLCIDNIRPGASTVPNAGRGAFATRKISQGSTIAPVPLVHFPDRSMLDMYDLAYDSNDNEYRREGSNPPIGRQLLENYVLGHKQSSMMFIPVGSTVPLINHSKEPNAKLVWSKHSSHQIHWLSMDPLELAEQSNLFAGLLLEVVALRDIDVDEEIFIDYGNEWQNAYDRHVTEWNAKLASGELSDKWPIKAVDFNDRYSRVPFETKDELERDYPSNVELKAFLMLKETDNAGSLEDPKIWDENLESGVFHHDNLFNVVVVRREEVADSVAVMPYVYTLFWDGGPGNTKYIANVHHEALVFVDKQGTSDTFVPNAFRHYIEIPDDVFPQGPWRNIA